MRWLRRSWGDVRWVAKFVWRDRELRMDLLRMIAVALGVIVMLMVFMGCATKPSPAAQHIREVHPVRPAPARNAPVVDPTEATLIWRNEEGVVDVYR